MAVLHPMRGSFLSFFILVLRFVTLAAKPISLFSIESFQGADFGTDFALLGDARLANGGSCVNLTTHSASSAGSLVFKKPFRLIDGKSGKPISFSTEFVFSMLPGGGGNGDGLAFVIVPAGDLSEIFGHGTFGISKNAGKIEGKFVAVEFDTRKDDSSGDLKGGHVGVDVGRSVSDQTSNVSPIRLSLNGGEKLQSWVDYEASSKRLEFRLNKFGSEKPYNPLISHSIDLLRMLGEREVLVGIGSSSRDSPQMSSVYAWNFRVRSIPNWLHSMPVDPRVHGDEHQTVPKRKNRALTILGGLIFATGCGTLVAFFILFTWVVFFSRNLAVSPEVPMKHLDCKYEKQISYEP